MRVAIAAEPFPPPMTGRARTWPVVCEQLLYHDADGARSTLTVGM